MPGTGPYGHCSMTDLRYFSITSIVRRKCGSSLCESGKFRVICNQLFEPMLKVPELLARKRPSVGNRDRRIDT